MITKQERLDRELAKGKSIAWWAIGYYNTAGNQFSPSLKVSVFDIPEYLYTCNNYPPPSRTIKVLVDYLGSMMWINIRLGQLQIGWGGDNPPSQQGKDLRRKLENIMSKT